jgi:hypothetical protein
MHNSTFHYMEPTSAQIETMSRCREATKIYAAVLIKELPDGPDKAYALRKLRELAMWTNVAITRHPDGSPRA